MPNILHFLTPAIKISGGVGKISQLIFRAIIYARIGFPICCSLSKPECLKCEWSLKSRPYFAPLTLAAVKLRRGK